LNPEWNAEFEFEKADGELQMDDDIEFVVRDKATKSTLGVVRLPVKDIAAATAAVQVSVPIRFCNY